MIGTGSSRAGGARAVKGKATRCMYGMSVGKTSVAQKGGTECLKMNLPKGK